MQQINGRDQSGASVSAPAPAVEQPSTALAVQHTQNDTRAVPDVYRAICQVAKELSRDGIGKGSRNQTQGYAFRGIDDIYNALSALLAGADLCILPRMLTRSQQEREAKSGGVLFYVVVHADFAFVSARDGSTHTVSTFGEAMDSADKATNKAMSAAYKYAAMQVFCIPTEGMADADATTPAPKATKHTPAQQAIVKAKLATMPQPAAQLAEQIPEPEGQYSYNEEVSMSAGERTEVEQGLAFDELKARYVALNAEKTYHAQLGLAGMRSGSDKPGTDVARAVYKSILIDLTKREKRAK